MRNYNLYPHLKWHLNFPRVKCWENYFTREEFYLWCELAKQFYFLAAHWMPTHRNKNGGSNVLQSSCVLCYRTSKWKLSKKTKERLDKKKAHKLIKNVFNVAAPLWDKFFMLLSWSSICSRTTNFLSFVRSLAVTS